MVFSYLVFLDRFRTKLFPYSPSFHAETLFYDDESSMRLNIYSYGRQSFFSDLTATVSGIEKKVGLSSDVRHIKKRLKVLESSYS